MNEQIDLVRNWLVNWPARLTDILTTIGLPIDANRVQWSVLQVALIVTALLAALALSGRLRALLERPMAAAAGNRQLARFAVAVRQQFPAILFSLLLWFCVVGMRAATWGSRSWFLTLVAALITAWVVISIASRAFENRTLGRVIEVGSWILVTLSLLGILPQAAALLDSIALNTGSFKLSLLTIVQGAVLLSVLLWLASRVSNILEAQLARSEDLTPAMRVLIGKILRFSLIVLASLVGLYAVGVDFTALTLVSGAVGVGLGFGLQKVVSNLVSGIILLLDKSIKPGDVISVGDSYGSINALNARYVSVSLPDGREVLVPNEDLVTEKVFNWSFNSPSVWANVTFGVSYDCDPHLVRELAVKVAEGHPRVIKNRKGKNVACHITAFGDSSVDFSLGFWIDDPANGLLNVRGDIYMGLWDSFKANNISIPYPHRELIMRNAGGAAAS